MIYNSDGIEIIVFDAYGTLFDVHSVRTELEALNGERTGELSRLWRTCQLEYTWLRSLMGRYSDFAAVTRDALRFACRSLGLACSPEIEGRMLEAYDHLQTYPEVRSALERLAREYPLAILSNGTPAMLAAAVANTGLEKLLTHVISVDEVRVYKPDPRVYALVESKTGVPPVRTIFVSSNPFDVCGARAFGFRTLWVRRGGVEWSELGFEPGLTVSSLKEI